MAPAGFEHYVKRDPRRERFRSILLHIGESPRSETAVCDRHQLIDQQPSRWLLLSLHRALGNEFLMTQGLIADMLVVRPAMRCQTASQSIALAWQGSSDAGRAIPRVVAT